MSLNQTREKVALGVFKEFCGQLISNDPPTAGRELALHLWGPWFESREH